MRLNLKLATVTAAAAATVMLAGPASAAVTFDPATGTGFVGKGDVQLAFGWNNAALQKNAGGVSFTYSASVSYEAVCSFVTGEGTRGEKIHNVEHERTTAVDSAVAYDARVKNQITGFNLTGLGATTTEGTVPVVDAPCMGNEGHDGIWSSVVESGSTGGLSVVYGGTSVTL